MSGGEKRAAERSGEREEMPHPDGETGKRGEKIGKRPERLRVWKLWVGRVKRLKLRGR
jgi:hypothetical protein